MRRRCAKDASKMRHEKMSCHESEKMRTDASKIPGLLFDFVPMKVVAEDSEKISSEKRLGDYGARRAGPQGDSLRSVEERVAPLLARARGGHQPRRGRSGGEEEESKSFLTTNSHDVAATKSRGARGRALLERGRARPHENS